MTVQIQPGKDSKGLWGIKEEFDLSNGEEAVMLIALGYADTSKDLWPRRSRKGFEKVATVV
jgi:nitroreductase